LNFSLTALSKVQSIRFQGHFEYPKTLENWFSCATSAPSNARPAIHAVAKLRLAHAFSAMLLE